MLRNAREVTYYVTSFYQVYELRRFLEFVGEDPKGSPPRLGGVSVDASPQMMRWTPPGDLNGIEVPKSSRIVD
jgi:hypothetical protein